MSKSLTHEDFSRAPAHDQSSDRSFGFVFAGFFLILAIWPIVRGRPLRMWALPLSATFLIVALIRPSLLKHLNRAWTRLGLLLGAVVNPIVTGLIFFVLIAPVAWVCKLAGRDPLRLRLEPETTSYWISADAADTRDMRRQF